MFTRIETRRLDQAHADDGTDETAKESPDRKRTEDSRAAISATEESSGGMALESSGDVTPEQLRMSLKSVGL